MLNANPYGVGNIHSLRNQKAYPIKKSSNATIKDAPKRINHRSIKKKATSSRKKPKTIKSGNQKKSHNQKIKKTAKPKPKQRKSNQPPDVF